MNENTISDAGELQLIECFARGTWIALGLASVCLGIDAYAMFWLPHHRVLAGETHGATFFAVALWTVEIVLALLGLWLVRFAFSRPPRFVPKD